MKKIAGIDIGFGDTKIWTENKYYKFPTAIAIDYERGVDLGSFGSKDKSYVYGDKRYIVGEDALLYDPLPTRHLEFLLQYSPVILAAAHDLIDFDYVVMGLPVGYFNHHKEIRSKLTNFAINERQMSFGVQMLPQGLGIICDYMYNNDGTTKNVLSNAIAIDMGYNTIDVLVFVNGKANSKLSFMMPNKGVCQIALKLAEKLSHANNVTVSEEQAKKFMLTKTYAMYGSSNDISSLVDELVVEYAERIISEIMIRADSILQHTDKVMLSGGGAGLIRNSIPKEYISKISHVVGELPEYANAVGFCKYGRRSVANASVSKD